MKTQPYVHVKGLGRCRVLWVDGDTFRVLRLKDDSTYRIKRDRIERFEKGKSWIYQN